ncbi:hypothetical protein BC941DRAFT_475027 [Chlamydoabsidia padenii]|nr:hypothetical protein BC941DRAFT_475027 [Chlamydoabsidia padenii]
MNTIVALGDPVDTRTICPEEMDDYDDVGPDAERWFMGHEKVMYGMYRKKVIMTWSSYKNNSGEQTSDCTQDIRQYNEMVYGSNDGEDLMERRIDLLEKCGEYNIEQSSMEIKKPRTITFLGFATTIQKPPTLVLDVAEEAKSAYEKRLDFEQLCEIVDNQDDMNPHSHHNIFFTPSKIEKKAIMKFYNAFSKSLKRHSDSSTPSRLFTIFNRHGG